MSQDPQLSLEFHASTDIAPRFWFAVDLYYDSGGQTSVNGVSQNNAANTCSAGATLNYRPWHDGKLLLQYKETLSAPGEAKTRSLTVYLAQLF